MWVLQSIMLITIIFLLCHILGTNFKCWFKIRSDFSIHYGFTILIGVYWTFSILHHLLHSSWQIYYWTTLTLMLLFILWQIFIFFKNKNWTSALQKSKKHLLMLFPLFLVIGVQLFINLGSWNADNAYGDNLFYIAQSLQQINADQIMLLQPATGVEGMLLPTNYIFSSWELFIAFLSYTFQLPVTIITSISVQVITTSIAYISIYSLAYALTKKRNVAICTAILFFISIIFSYNYTGKLEEFSMEGWFLYFNHVGKVIFKYTILVGFFELLVHVFYRRKVIYEWRFQIIAGFALYMFAATALTQLAIINIFLLSALFCFLLLFYKIGWKNKKYLLISCIPSLVILIWFMLIDGELHQLFSLLLQPFISAPDTGTAVATATTQGFSINVETWTSQLNNFMGSYYWYVPLSFAIMITLFVIILLNFLFKDFYHRHNSNDKVFLFFYLIFPFFFYLFTISNPLTSAILTKFLPEFGFYRLLGNMLPNIFVIIFITYIIFLSFEGWKKYRFVPYILLIVICILFIILPTRTSVPAYAASDTRLNNRKYISDTFDGQINYFRLLENPYKLSQDTLDIAEYFENMSKSTRLLIDYNMFYGPTYLRNYLQNVEVYNTRFSGLPGEAGKNIGILNDYVTKQDMVDNINELLAQAGINYVIVKDDKSKVIDDLEKHGYTIETSIDGYLIFKVN